METRRLEVHGAVSSNSPPIPTSIAVAVTCVSMADADLNIEFDRFVYVNWYGSFSVVGHL